MLFFVIKICVGSGYHFSGRVNSNKPNNQMSDFTELNEIMDAYLCLAL